MANIESNQQKVIAALLLQFANPGLTQKEACETVELEPRTYRNWIQRGDETVNTLRQLIDGMQREMLLEASMIQLEGIRLLKKDVLKENVDISERIKGLRFFRDLAKELQETYHAIPGQEERAHEFLQQGPVTKLQDSTFSHLEIRAGQDGGLTMEMVSQPEDIEDAEFHDVDEER